MGSLLAHYNFKTMPIKVTREDGTEFEALTPEEIKTKDDAMERLQNDLKVEQEKDKNFSTLKTGMESEINKIKEELSIEKKRNDDYQTKSITETRSEIITGLAGGDKDLATKIEAEFNGFAGTATTRTEIFERAKKAFNIVSPSTSPTAIDSFMNGIGGRGAVVKPNDQVVETPEQAAQRRKMGISDEDNKKYSSQIK